MEEDTLTLEETQMEEVQTASQDGAAVEMPPTAEEEQPIAEEGDPQARVAELEGAVVQQEERLRLMEASAQELREALAERDARSSGLEAELHQAQQQVAATVAKYRTALLASAPEVPEEMVQGETVEELDAALEQGRQMVERIRSNLEAQAAAARVPAGAPVRGAPDLSSLSPREKIAHALGQR